MVSGKDDIRRLLEERRDAVLPADRAQRSARIWDELLAYCEPADQRIGLYAAVRSEVETEGLFHRLRARRCQLFYPRCRLSGRLLDFVPVADPGELQPGAFEIPEPAGEPVDLDRLDLVVVPGLAFDRRGARLGYGQGYYDRTLAAFGGGRVGLAFGAQILEKLPVDIHDQPMDAVITEDGVLRSRRATPEAACLT